MDPFPPAPHVPLPLQGVLFTAPPSHLMDSINASVMEAAAALNAHPDKNAALVGVADLNGMNAALLVRVADGWQIKGYVGKDWKGPFSAGAEILGVF